MFVLNSACVFGRYIWLKLRWFEAIMVRAGRQQVDEKTMCPLYKYRTGQRLGVDIDYLSPRSLNGVTLMAHQCNTDTAHANACKIVTRNKKHVWQHAPKNVKYVHNMYYERLRASRL